MGNFHYNWAWVLHCKLPADAININIEHYTFYVSLNTSLQLFYICFCCSCVNSIFEIFLIDGVPQTLNFRLWLDLRNLIYCLFCFIKKFVCIFDTNWYIYIIQYYFFLWSILLKRRLSVGNMFIVYVKYITGSCF